MTKGTAHGTASAGSPGYHDYITVTIQAEQGKIISCRAEGDGEYRDPNLGGRAMTELPARIVAENSVEVDGIAAATVSSKAILQAAKAAWQKLSGEDEPPAVHMKPGTYTAGAPGFWGIWDLPVEITVNETSLLGISVPEKRQEHGETEVMLNCVKEKLIPRMLRNQSVAVDAIAGCTATSSAVKQATEKALLQALEAGGSDPAAIRHFWVRPEKPEAGQVEELTVDLVVVGMSTGGIFAMKSALETFMRNSDMKQRIKILGVEKAGKIGGQSCLTHETNALNPKKLLEEVYDGKDLCDGERYRDDWIRYCTGKDGQLKAKPEMIDLYMRESGPTVDWMRYQQGYMFGTVLGHSPFSNFDHLVQWNYYSTTGRDKFQQSFEDRRMAVNGVLTKLVNEVCSAGGSYLLETEAYAYLQDEATGRVTGIRARNTVTGKEYIIHAGAVISASGGFGLNRELMNRLLNPKWAGEYLQVGNHCNDGTFFQAGLDAGAGTWNADMPPIAIELGLPAFLKHFPIHNKEGQITGRTGRTSTWTYNDIPLYLVFSIDSLAVSPKGERFGNELGLGKGIGDDTAPNSWKIGPYFYSIWSQPQLDRLNAEGFRTDHISSRGAYRQQGGFPLDQPAPVLEAMAASVEQGLAWKADSIRELASLLDMDPDVLERTVARYNDLCQKGADEDFGKDAQFLTPLSEGPYYAVKAMNVMFGSGGGFDVDEKLRVLRSDGKSVIDGMYAVGTDSLGVIQSNERNYTGFGGVAQGWLTMSGRLAGQYAAEYVYETFGLVNQRDPEPEAKPFS